MLKLSLVPVSVLIGNFCGKLYSSAAGPQLERVVKTNHEGHCISKGCHSVIKFYARVIRCSLIAWDDRMNLGCTIKVS
ncbi:hypothetical protein BGW80DRAFT_1312270 [Lactifluus volemus]|nr:hypothetical protein BGW80DRAFT_1312270 [Lactifluus volemus]